MGKQKTPVNQPKPSYRDLDPLEQGGPIARRGFAYQDHVAAGKCLDMLLGGGPAEVWCEAEDDIVLVWLIQGEELFEFVQVKSNELDQLWTVAKLCEKEAAKDDKGPGACIVEKSLAHDRGKGKCRFRFVTCRELFKQKPTFQLIVCGRAFKNLKDVHRIPLSKVWKQPEPDDSDEANDTPSLFPDVEEADTSQGE